jgi:vacuolar-type H+-ATPase subunit E/Vma4
METKDRLSKALSEAGIFKKINEIQAKGGNVVEKKGGRWHVACGRW